MELRDALGQISEIREQMARSSVFRGFRALPVAATGLLAVIGAAVQPSFVPDPAADVNTWLVLWIGVAILSVLVTGAEMALRYARTREPLARTRTRLALRQFVPCLVAGAALLPVLRHAAPEVLWMLPGLWCVLFSLGIFASRPVLPRALGAVGLFYLAAGLLVLALAHGKHAYSPLALGVPFGAGQALAAVLLYWTLERDHDHPEAEV